MREPFFVVVNAHVTCINRSNYTFGLSELYNVSCHVLCEWGSIWSKNFSFNSSREKCIVNAPKYITFRIARRKNCFRNELTGISTKNDFNGDSCFLGELIKNSFGWQERVVSQKRQFFSFHFVASSASAEHCRYAKKCDYIFFHFLTFLWYLCECFWLYNK